MSTFELLDEYVSVTCGHGNGGCGLTFAMTASFYREVNNSGRTWYCPNGHPRVYRGESAESKLRKAEVRETALRDQLGAAVREAENVRAALLRDRQRFVNGACPCCNRSFDNVRRHMATKHPDYDHTRVGQPTTVRFSCGCGRSFPTFSGLRIHQGRARSSGWDEAKAPAWRAHLTKV